MKKLFFFAALLAATLCATAQQNQVIWQNGKVMYGSPIPTVDSITFAAEIESSDTLHLILPRTIIKEVHDTTIKEVIVVVHDTIYQYIVTDPQAVKGIFSVSAEKKVMFSKGNLQYTQSTDTWAFAANQYEMIGEANIENDALADKIDLFGWSGSTATAQWGISISKTTSDYSGDFVDWGKNVGDGSTWRTLTQDEWDYLCNTRANAASLMGVARINLDEEGTIYANGLILLPDTWTCPEDVTFKSGLAILRTVQAYADYQTLTLEQWKKLETTGAVFLPAAGDRSGSIIYDVQLTGSYWFATTNHSAIAYYLQICPDETEWFKNSRYNGYAVRLVQDL